MDHHANSRAPAAHRPRRHWPYLVLAYACIGLAFAGIVLPGLPTTPFLLVAAWAASRGSEKLHRWLYEHPRLGPPLRAWEQQRAVPARAKAAAVFLLALSWVIMLVSTDGPLVPLITGILFVVIGTYVVTRPTPR